MPTAYTIFLCESLSTEPEPVANKPVLLATAEFRMELRRGTSSVSVKLPSELAGDCGTWLREWLRCPHPLNDN